jgi:hypothetical protein
MTRSQLLFSNFVFTLQDNLDLEEGNKLPGVSPFPGSVNVNNAYLLLILL